MTAMLYTHWLANGQHHFAARHKIEQRRHKCTKRCAPAVDQMTAATVCVCMGARCLSLLRREPVVVVVFASNVISEAKMKTNAKLNNVQMVQPNKRLRPNTGNKEIKHIYTLWSSLARSHCWKCLLTAGECDKRMLGVIKRSMSFTLLK